jgi:hypothetical protein
MEEKENMEEFTEEEIKKAEIKKFWRMYISLMLVSVIADTIFFKYHKMKFHHIYDWIITGLFLIFVFLLSITMSELYDYLFIYLTPRQKELRKIILYKRTKNPEKNKDNKNHKI